MTLGLSAAGQRTGGWRRRQRPWAGPLSSGRPAERPARAVIAMVGLETNSSPPFRPGESAVPFALASV